jgi:V/A-type H+-transporting ATPase subunit D
MDENSLPTKKNLLIAKQQLILSRKGHDLLDIKYNVLLRELKILEKNALEMRKKFEKAFLAANRARDIAEALTEKKVKDEFPYNLKETNIFFDEAFLLLKEASALKIELEKIEEALLIQKNKTARTRKRVSALRNIAIPSYEARVKYIADQLEEHERDETVRLKVVNKR